MDNSYKPFVSVILTTFNEDFHLDRILNDLVLQNYPDEKMEILLLEAGNEDELRIRHKFEKQSNMFKYYCVPNLSRTASLNLLVKESKGEIIIRVDARTKVLPNYIHELVRLST